MNARQSLTVPTDWASRDVLHTDFCFILPTSSSFLLPPLLCPFSLIDLPPLLSHMHIIVYRQNRLPKPRHPLHLNLRGEKDEEDEEDGVGEVAMAWGWKETIESRWKRGRWEKSHARWGRDGGENVWWAAAKKAEGHSLEWNNFLGRFRRKRRA